MKAAAITALGGPEVVRLIDAEVPRLTPDHALVRVKSVGLNWLDVMARTENFGLQFPHIGGSDVAGVIEKPGEESSLPAGAEVLINPAYPCHQCRPCTVGDRECQFVRILGLHVPGGYGQYVAIPTAQLFVKPERISFEQAAAFPLDFITAWRMLMTRGRLGAGETVFVWGATGALGVAAIQLARHVGARVIAAVGDSRLTDAITNLGAHLVVNYKTEDVVSAVRSATDSLGADLVFESVGRATLPRSIELVRAGGRIVICGTRSGNTAEIDFSELYYKQISVIGSRMGTATDFWEVYSLLLGGLLDVHVGRVMPISQISKAHQLLENRDFVGKIVLDHER